MEGENILELISKDSKSLDFSLKIDEKKFNLRNVSIKKSTTPVHSPTLRGGVYFSDKIVYKMKATVDDTRIVSKLSKFMLGPNTDYHPLEIYTSISDNNQKKTITIKAYLTNSMQSSSHVELNLIVVNSEYS